jgi:hypothetical protein
MWSNVADKGALAAWIATIGKYLKNNGQKIFEN